MVEPAGNVKFISVVLLGDDQMFKGADAATATRTRNQIVATCAQLPVARRLDIEARAQIRGFAILIKMNTITLPPVQHQIDSVARVQDTALYAMHAEAFRPATLDEIGRRLWRRRGSRHRHANDHSPLDGKLG